MNFEMRTILTALAGNNASQRSVSVRVMNEIAPTVEQMALLANRYDAFKMNARLSLAGFLVSNGTLRDGTQYRIVSNSGMDVVMMWPASGVLALDLFEWFRTIPTSDTFRNGYATDGSKMSQSWKITDFSRWPAKLQQTTTRDKHPGHITWSNTALKLNDKPLVLSWRGPRSRYASTTGLTGPTSGAPVAHEVDPTNFPSPYVFGDVILLDTGFVWINGHKVDTGLAKVIAACFFEFDPAGHPKKYVLRVVTDLTAGVRQLSVVDLVVTSGALGDTLPAFASAKTALLTKATYVAANNTNSANAAQPGAVAGQWDYWQRPHFNKSGTRLATLIVLVGANGSDRETHAVSFVPETWAFDDDHVVGIDVTYSTDFVSTSTPWTATTHDVREQLVACDFEGDTFVYVKYKIDSTRLQSGQGVAGDIGGSATGTRDENETWVYTMTHSLMGALKQFTVTLAYHLDYHSASGGTGLTHWTGSQSLTVGNAWRIVSNGTGFTPPPLAFFGDLSKRSFVVGYPEQNVATNVTSGTLNVTQSNTAAAPSILCSGTATRARLVFDAYLDGVKALDGQTGSYTNAAAATTTGGFGVTMNTGDIIPTAATTESTNNNFGVFAKYGSTNPQTPPQMEGRFGSAITGHPRATIYSQGNAPIYQHCAVHPEKKAAYFGAAYYEDLYGNSPVVAGLEITVVDGGSTGPVTHNPPAYATGAHPTMSVPMFMGRTNQGNPQ